MRTLALVESPAQLVNVVEWAHHPVGDRADLRVVVLAPRNERSRAQLRRTAVLAREAGLEVGWHEPRLGGAATARTVRALAADLTGVQRLVVGDPFSGVMQVVISVARATEVVVVDDGTATLEFARQWISGEHLARWHQAATPGHRRQVAAFARDQVAGSFRRRLSADSGCTLRVFSCLPLHLPKVSVVRNSFDWLRRRFPAPGMKENADLVGTSLVETGVVDVDAYLQAVETLTRQHAVDRYFAHRKENRAKLDRIERLGLQVVCPDLPLEVVLRAGPVGRRVISFPSTVVHTLPLVLADVACDLVVCAIEDAWLTRSAPDRSGGFLRDVTATATDRFGLTTVAC